MSPLKSIAKPQAISRKAPQKAAQHRGASTLEALLADKLEHYSRDSPFPTFLETLYCEPDALELRGHR